MMISKNTFADLPVTTEAVFLQLPTIKGKLIFSPFFDKDRIKYLLGLQLWHLLKYAKLTEVVKQNDKLFVDLLNKVRVGGIDDEVENY